MGKNSALVNVLSFVAMPVLGIFLAMVVGGPGRPAPAAAMAGALAIVGGVLLIAAKIPRFASGRLVSFGARGLPTWARFAYAGAYGALVFSLAALAAAFQG